jgi:predicted ribosomally synthesized peptide with SipW-like signal peptide
MIRAILAGGLVLGVGAAVTMAAWNDSEFVTGTFPAGTFNMQGSTTDGTTFTDHPVGAPGTLTFTVAPLLLSPGDTVYAPFAVRLAANTTNNANVVITSPATTTGSVANLTYEVDRTATWGCSSASVDTNGAAMITAGTALTTVAGPNTFALTKGTPVTAAGATQFLCFKVTAGSGLTQGQTGTVTWQFTASSN